MAVKKRVVLIFAFICFYGHAQAALPPGLFDNKSEAGVFKAKIKRDIFYTAEELANIKEANRRLQEAARLQQPQLQPVTPNAGQGQPAFQPPVPPQPQPQPQPQPAQAPKANVEGSQSVEIFNVEGIIKIGGRGCAIVNSRLWFVGKPEQGYELIKLHPEAVEIKLPNGSVVKHKLMKTR